ncbi:MAG: TadE/TadG family type IV pilus assembly protein [Acetobacteraceae bacterium]|nr:TadE/TadG family type IV pilus assembly protein [Acetobacteraceae bacterium]
MRQRAGTAAVEFALLAPLFILAFAGMIDLGNAIYTQIRLEAAVAAGANFAMLPTSIANVTQAHAATLANNIAAMVTSTIATDAAHQPGATVAVNNGPTVTVPIGSAAQTAGGSSTNVATSFYCPTGSPPNWTWGASVNASTACAGGGVSGQFITITASYTFTAFFPYHFVQNGTMTVGMIVQTK